MQAWQTHFDERELKEIEYCKVYAEPRFRHGTGSHNIRLIVAKLAEILSKVTAISDTELDEIEARANAATPDPWQIGITDPELDPVELFRQHLALGATTDVWNVWCPEHPRTKGEYPRPDHAVIAAITGNGPDSENNARFIAEARTDILKLIAALRG